MEFNYFKDILFDLINECNQFPIRDIQVFDRENRLLVYAENGACFEVCLREVSRPESLIPDP